MNNYCALGGTTTLHNLLLAVTSREYALVQTDYLHVVVRSYMSDMYVLHVTDIARSAVAVRASGARDGRQRHQHAPGRDVAVDSAAHGPRVGGVAGARACRRVGRRL